MASGTKTDEYQIDPDAERRYRLARRDDLADRFGIVMGVPEHAPDDEGNWRYGIGMPVGGMANQEMVIEFTAEMRALVKDSAAPLVESGVVSRREADAFDAHDYETGPAAQGWPQIFIDLYQQFEPTLTGGATLIAWAEFLRTVASGLQTWKANRERRFQDTLGEAYNRAWPSDYTPTVVMTQPAIVALCYADLTERHGITGPVRIDILPRDKFKGYASPDHPAGGETYLIRFISDSNRYFYLVDGLGMVSEHYLERADEFVLLPLPDLLPNERSLAKYRDPMKAQCIEIE
jgi:hypothetical protein